jgi:soluble lytic murein transglycosylase-like protein
MRCLLVLWFAGAAWAGEFAVLSSGGRLHVDGHEIEGGKVLLRLGSGTIEVEATEVQAFEADDAAALATESKPAVVPIPEKPAASPTPQQLADAAAKKYGLPGSLLRSVMKAESGFRPNAVSPKGAIGLMQLTPSTAQTLGANPQDPAQNVDAGARYLRALLEKYGGALRHALAAYNAGPGAVAKFGGVPPFTETLDYIRRVERDWKAAR